MSPFASVRTALQTPRPIHRAVLLAAGLLMLFVAVQLLPSGGAPPPVTASAAHADGAAPATRATPAPRDGVRLFGAGNGLALLLLAGGGLFAMHLRRRNAGAATPGALQPLGQLALGPHGHLRLVRCGDDVLLLGVTAQQVTLIRRYASDAFADAGDGAPALPHFAELLHSAAGHAAYSPKVHA